MGHPVSEPLLAFFKDEEVVLAIVFGEVETADLAKPGALDFGADSGFGEAVVVALAVFVNDAEAGVVAHGKMERGEHWLRVGDLVVDLQHQHGVDGVGWEFGVLGCAEDGLNVVEVFFIGTLLDGLDVLRINVFRVDDALGADLFGGKHGEPASTCADVCNAAARQDVEQIHDAVDVQALGAAGGFEDAEVAGVGRAGGVLLRSLRGGGECGGEREEGEKTHGG